MIDPEPDIAPLGHPLERGHGAYQRALILRHALRSAAGGAWVITIAVLLGAAWVLGPDGAWTRFVLVLAAIAIALARGAAQVRRASLTLDGYLERAEHGFPQLRSWLRNAIDLERHPAPHTSPGLAQALAHETRRRLADLPLRSLTPRLEARAPLLSLLAAGAAVVGLGLLMPARVTRSFEILLRPDRASPEVRLAVEPGSVTVSPGTTLAVRARVWGTGRTPRLTREPGPALPAVAEGRAEDGARLWRFDLAQLTHEQSYRVRVASAQSPRYRIALSGDVAPVSFDIEYRAPAYARLPVQRGAAARGDLAALRGTRAHLVVTFDRDLASLAVDLPDGQPARWKSLTPRRWEGDVPIDREGRYVLRARPVRQGGGPEPSEHRFAYSVSPLADQPPVLAVRLPAGDVDLPSGQQIPLDVLAEDDLGLSELTLQVRKDPAGPWTDVPLARFGQRPREARVAAHWDAAPLALLPGETAAFRFVLFDDNAVSGRGRAVSSTFELRFPSLADLYDRVDHHQADAQTALEKVAEQARELQKSLDKLARQPQRQGTDPPQSFERSEELQSALQRQQQLTEQIEQAGTRLQQSVEQAAERQAFEEQLMRKLHEMSQLMDQIQSPDFKEAMRKMQEALDRMDHQPLEQNLNEWRKQNQEMLANLERTVELLKKLRQEERLQSLAQRARELQSQQEALNQEHAAATPRKDDSQREASLPGRQNAAAEQSKQLAEDVRQTETQNDDAKLGEPLEQAAQELSHEAAPSQSQAASAAAQGQKSQAQQAGQQASQSLSKAAEHLSQAAQQAQQKQNELNLAALRRAARDLVSLQRSSEDNMASNTSQAEKSDQQTDLSEGTARVADSLFALARETPFISPRLGEALGRAMNQLSRSGRELGTGNRARGEEAGRAGSQSLNEAVLELRATESSMCNKPGAGQMAGRLDPQRLGQVGQRQSQLNRDSRSLAQRLSQQMRLSTGDREQMRRLGEEQARIREQLEQIKHDEESRRELLGRLDQTAREMKDVEETLQNGTAGSDLEEKQQRILSRLLDAERSVHRRDFEPQRESRPGEDVARSGPPELPADLLRVNDRLRHDLLKAEADRYPAQYRAFVEAYLRSLNGSPR
ncbi:MAG: hypothetical protein E6K78_05695 [Candidatus Eisenbacteria bacterium]|uniref:DUF4175 family protein n=1 Tax=Eiseniibacteriota bacterium TaxID=2212470 RepID=A0A538TTW8_UNCEI|nr:MAG: hypothetical protein E6K78_05695 [Candidatus Eisenbacteria bacterium]